MNLTQVAVRRPVATSMAFIAIIFLGWISLSKIPLALMPDAGYPLLSVITRYRGVSPQKMESLITKPIEEKISTISGIKNVYSVSEEGESRINVEFEVGTGMDFAALYVREAVSLVKKAFPREVEEPLILRYDPSQSPIIILTLSGERDPRTLRTLAEQRIKRRIERLDGVAEVEVGGGAQREIIINIDGARLMAYNLSISDLVRQVQWANFNLPAGKVEENGTHYLAHTLGRFQTLKDIGSVGVGYRNGDRAIFLRDVAQIEDGAKDEDSLSRVNGQERIAIYVQKTGSANTIEVARRVVEEIDSLILPGVVMEVAYNQADFIERAINRVRNMALSGGILAVIVLFVFLRRITGTLIIALSIPISIIATFNFMFFQKITLNIISLSGLALGVGMLVDNSIVVLENIARAGRGPHADHRGDDFREKVIERTRSVAPAILASTLTTIAVFLPIIFIKEDIRRLYQGLSFTVGASLLVSLAVALTLVPMLAYRLSTWEEALSRRPRLYLHRLVAWMVRGKGLWNADFGLQMKNEPTNIPQSAIVNPKSDDPNNKDGQRLSRSRTESWSKTSLLPALASARLAGSGTRNGTSQSRKLRFTKAQPVRLYSHLLILTIRYRWIFLLLILLLFIATLLVAPKLKREYFSIDDQGEIRAFVELPTGTGLTATSSTVRVVEKTIRDFPQIERVSTKVEKWHADLVLQLVPRKERRETPGEMIELLKRSLENVSGAFVHFSQGAGSGSGGRELDVEISGDDIEVLTSLARKMAGKIQGIEGIGGVVLRFREGRPELRIRIDRAKATLAGFYAQDIAQAVRSHLHGPIATKYIENNQEIDVRLRLRPEDRRTLSAIGQVRLISPYGYSVSLNEISTFELTRSPTRIWRKDGRRIVTITARLKEDLDLGTAGVEVHKAQKELELPKDYSYKLGRNYQQLTENQYQLLFAVGLTVVIMYMILAALFESFIQPFIIILSIPLAAIGVIWSLFLSANSVNLAVYIGAIMLAGIVVNNAVVLIDRINQLRARGIGKLRAIVSAGKNRLRPIVMTALTTILGLLPMAFDKSEGSNLWGPLAITVVSGISASTLLTLLVVPTAYFILARK